MQLLEAPKTLLSPWKWFGGGYIVVQGQFDDDDSYLSPDEAEKARLLRYDWCEGFDLDQEKDRKRALAIEKAEKMDGQSFRVFKTTHWLRSGRSQPTFGMGTWDHFPTEPKVWEAVGEEWCGEIR